MKPLNLAQRRRSFLKFLGFYAFALAAILLPLLSFKLWDFQGTENKCRVEQEKLKNTLARMNSLLDTLYNELDSKYVNKTTEESEREKLKSRGEKLLKNLDILKEQLPETPLSRAAINPTEIVENYHGLLLRIFDTPEKPVAQPNPVCEIEIINIKFEIKKLKREIEDNLKTLEKIDFKKKQDDEEKKLVGEQVKNIRSLLNSMNY